MKLVKVIHRKKVYINQILLNSVIFNLRNLTMHDCMSTFSCLTYSHILKTNLQFISLIFGLCGLHALGLSLFSILGLSLFACVTFLMLLVCLYSISTRKSYHRNLGIASSFSGLLFSDLNFACQLIKSQFPLFFLT